MIPAVRFEANACNTLENSESAPSAGCTDRTTSLDRYATLATGDQLIGQSMLHICIKGPTTRSRAGHR